MNIKHKSIISISIVVVMMFVLSAGSVYGVIDGCSSYLNQADCEAEECWWCPDCVGFYIFNGMYQCVDSATQCSFNGCDKDTCNADCVEDADCDDSVRLTIDTCKYDCTCDNIPVECTLDSDCTHLDDECADGECNLDTYKCEQIFKSDTYECRAQDGDCDVAETCTGSSADCPADGVEPDTEECRGSAGICDVAENCDGTNKACPTDIFLPDTTECRAEAGDCDIAEYCTGNSADCPADDVEPITTECRSSAGICDVEEYCDGKDVDCPADEYEPVTTECRGKAGVCDIAEFCTALGPDCPSDEVEPTTTECRADAGDCDVAEDCDGTNVDCPVDEYEPQGTDCGVCAECDDLGTCGYDETQDDDCSDNNEDEIATCDWMPDDFHPTWDYAPAFTSECKAIFECTEFNPDTITHECDMENCDAECEDNGDCVNYCEKNVWYHSGTCDTTTPTCACSYTETDCDDQDPCTIDTCDADTGCSHEHSDDIPPETIKIYGDPHYPANINDPAPYPHWITSQTPINLTATDYAPDTECISGVDEIYWRNILLDKPEDWHYCQTDCEAWDIGNPAYQSGPPFEEYTGPIYKTEPSCHIIEYFSVDNVGNPEETKWQCVFVDNQPPIQNKTIEEPYTEWYPVDVADDPLDPDATHFYGADNPDINIVTRCWKDATGAPIDNSEDCKADANCIECWKTTTDTKISIECTDPEPHPVDYVELCFAVELDAEDATPGYCMWYGGNYDAGTGYCCLTDRTSIKHFKFREESEHNLKFYCEDALGNRGPEDEEKFKVIGDMFKIRLNDKWNLISVPFVLLNDKPEEVFEDTPSVKTVYSYDENGDWHVYRAGDPSHSDLEHIVPGEGYWVLADCEEPVDKPENHRCGCGPDGDKCDMLVIGGSLYNAGPVVPPSVKVGKTEEGWNLIGYYGTEGRWWYNGPDSFYWMDAKEAYCSLYSLRNLEGGLLQPTKWSALVSYWEPDNNFLPWTSPWKELELCDEMAPGAGYWIGMDAEGTYKRDTICDDSILGAFCEVPYAI